MINVTTKFNFTAFYKHYELCYSNKTKPTQSFLEWFIGFTEGDGIIQNSNKTLGQQMLLFEITLHPSDIAVLHFIKHNFGLGSVNKVYTRDACRYRLGGIKAISCLILLFNGNVPKFGIKDLHCF